MLHQFLSDLSQNASTGSLITLLITGGWVMLPLALLSVITLTLILVCIFTLRLRSMVTNRYMDAAEVFLKKEDLSGLLALSQRHREALAIIMSSILDFSLRHPEATFAEIRDIAQTEGTRVATLLQQRITWLSDIATIAPMLGLLGTVFGMIRSFNVMANDVAATRPMLLAGGVAQALVATAAGLVIGIAAMGTYALFKSRVNHMVSDLEAATGQLLAMLPKRK
jgi:biopolymer transport protein ExbB